MWKIHSLKKDWKERHQIAITCLWEVDYGCFSFFLLFHIFHFFSDTTTPCFLFYFILFFLFMFLENTRVKSLSALLLGKSKI